jgi:hypothetical protein
MDDFERWRPQVDNKVADLNACVNSLRQQLEEFKSSSASPNPVIGEGSAPLKTSKPAHLGASSLKAVSELLGHGYEPMTTLNGELVRGIHLGVTCD